MHFSFIQYFFISIAVLLYFSETSGAELKRFCTLNPVYNEYNYSFQILFIIDR